MIISLNWLKKFTEIDMPVDELATLIGARLVEIEEVIDLGSKYADVLVAKVVECNKLEGSDHLSVTKIDDGGKNATVERDANGLVQVVCGAPNITAGQFVAWLPPESVVPSTYGKPEPFVLGSRKLCGVISQGMIASAKELDLFDEHDGILVLDENLVPGSSFAEAYELNDYLFDIENKSLTHRPDCFGIIGFAREVAAITGRPFKTPDWLMNVTPDFESVQSDGVELKVSIDDDELSPRYQAIVMAGADGNKQSPLQIQTYLARVGVRPISAVVDVTNYLMMLTGQPLHAFDYDKLVAVGEGVADIHVRAGQKGEKLELLDGKVIELTADDIVIAAGKTAIGLAGAMGGANTEIDKNTKRIIIEAASFNLYNLRATQMRHGIFSEAITRFTKGQPASLTAPVLFDAVRLMSEWSGAKSVSKVADAYPLSQEKISVGTSVDDINGILGSKFSYSDIAETLNNVEFGIEKTEEKIQVTIPYWRGDIHIIEDVAEEVGRLTGFDNIESTLPLREFIATKPTEFDEFKSMLRQLLVRAGASEVLTYSFVHGDVIKKAGLNPSNSYQVINSISPDLQYYRQTLTPSLLDLVHPNVKQSYESFALFEMNKTHAISDGLNDEKVPVESERLALVVVDKYQTGASYYSAKRIFDYICNEIGVTATYEPIENQQDHQVMVPFEFRRSARFVDADLRKCNGVIGEYTRSVAKAFKLPEHTAGFDIDVKGLFAMYKNGGRKYTPISRYPYSERDICFKVNQTTKYSQVIDAAEHALQTVPLESNLVPVDIYQPGDSETKNITIRLRVVSHDHTLTGDEVAEAVETVSRLVIEQTGAEVV